MVAQHGAPEMLLASDYNVVLTHGNGPQVGLDLPLGDGP